MVLKHEAPIDPPALSAALMAGMQAADAVQDGGTCNLDSAFFPLGKGVRSAPIVRQLVAAGLPASQTRWIGMRGVLSSYSWGGQANKRCEGNRAFCRALRDAGVQVIEFYQAD